MRRVSWGVAALLRAAELQQARGQAAQALAARDKAARYLARLKCADDRGVTRTDLDAAETDEAAATLLGLVCVPGLFVLFRRGRRFSRCERLETTDGNGSSQLG